MDFPHAEVAQIRRGAGGREGKIQFSFELVNL